MSMPAAPAWLVIGADGLLGAALCRRIATGRPVVATTRRKPPGSGKVWMDLANADQWPITDDIGAAFLCASMSGFANCANDRYEAHRINVTAPLTLARRLAAQGVAVIVPSTSAVFDGSVAFPKPNTPRRPVGDYGQQKAELEDGLATLEGVTVLRITKIASARDVRFAGLLNGLAANRPVEALEELRMAPVDLEGTLDALCTLAARPTGGIRHHSGNREISYAAFARLLAERLGAATSLVRSQALPAGLNLPLHAALDMSPDSAVPGIAAPSPEQVADRILEEIAHVFG